MQTRSTPASLAEWLLVALQIARGGEGALLKELCPDGEPWGAPVLVFTARAIDRCPLLPAGVRRVQDAIIQLASKPKEASASKGEDKQSPHVLLDYVATRTIRRLMLYGQQDEVAREFAHRFWREVLQGRTSQWFGSHADKVLASALGCGDSKVAAAAKKELQPLVGKGKGGLEGWAETHGLRKAPQ